MKEPIRTVIHTDNGTVIRYKSQGGPMTEADKRAIELGRERIRANTTRSYGLKYSKSGEVIGGYCNVLRGDCDYSDIEAAPGQWGKREYLQ